MACSWMYCSILMLNAASMLIQNNDAASVPVDSSLVMEKRDHIGTEFYLATTNNLGYSNITLHITSESSGILRVSMTYPKIYEEITLVQGYTQFNLSASGYTASFSTYSGIHIISSVPVAIVVLDVGFRQSAGAFLALPVALSGTLFMAAAYKGYYFAIQCGIQVVATTDNTTVTLQDPVNNPVTVQLNRLDKTVIERGPDITGTIVTASKPVSVISGTRGAAIPYGIADMLIEQMVPYDAWTDNYIVPPLHSTSGYLVRTLSFVDQKVCFENQTSSTCIEITKSSNTSYMFGDEPVAISSQAPISVVQYAIVSHRSGPFMNLVPGVSNYVNGYKFSIPDVIPDIKHFVTLMIPSAEAPGLRLDGSFINDDYMNLYNISTPDDNYTVLIMNISDGYHEIEHIDNQVKFGALAYGISDKHSYGWLLGFTYLKPLDSGLITTPWTECNVTCGIGSQTRMSCSDLLAVLQEDYESCYQTDSKLCNATCTDTAAIAVPYGQNCTINEDRCEGANTECNSGRCLCVAGYYLDGVDCLSTATTVPYGQNCTINEDRCEGANTECNSGRCLCVAGYYLDGVDCLSTIAIPYGQNCTINEYRCEGANTECSSGRCRCVAGYYLDGVDCLSTARAVPYGQNCTINEDRCEGANTECNSGRCRCVAGYYLDGVDCLSTAIAIPYGQNCTINEYRCEGVNTECSSGRCRCVAGYYLDGVDCLSRSSICPICSTDETAVIVAVCMGVITLVIAGYATCVTVLLRRSMATPRQSNNKRPVTSKHVNGAFHSDSNEPARVTTEDVRTHNGTIADEALYTSLDDGYMDVTRTYNIIRRN